MRPAAIEEKRDRRPVRMGRSPKTISNAIVPLREMLEHAVEWGYLASNPAARLRRPRDARPADAVMSHLEPAEIRRLLAAAEQGLAYTLLLTAVTTGMRMGELRGVQWRDVERDIARVWVRRTIGLEGVQSPKSRRSVRAIAMPPTLTTALAEHYLQSDYKAPDNYVFTSDVGTPLDPSNMRKLFRDALRRSGVKPVRFHDLRHSYASVLVDQGAHPKFISEQLGHASVQITMDRYSHLFDQSYSDESTKLEAALFGDQKDDVAVR